MKLLINQVCHLHDGIINKPIEQIMDLTHMILNLYYLIESIIINCVNFYHIISLQYFWSKI